MFSGLPTTHPTRWTTALSFTLQAAIVSTVLVLPLLYPHNLPEAFARRKIFAPMREGDVHAVPNREPSRQSGVFHPAALVVNQRTFIFHPNTTDSANDSTHVPDMNNVIDSGTRDGIPNSIGSGPEIPKPRPPVSATPPRVSRMMEGNLIRRVDPSYPAIARQAGVQGAVVIKAIISRDGAIEHIELLGGPALLTGAAMQAVGEWKYRPYYLNGEPVEVETQITVNFVLNR